MDGGISERSNLGSVKDVEQGAAWSAFFDVEARGNNLSGGSRTRHYKMRPPFLFWARFGCNRGRPVPGLL